MTVPHLKISRGKMYKFFFSDIEFMNRIWVLLEPKPLSGRKPSVFTKRQWK